MIKPVNVAASFRPELEMANHQPNVKDISTHLKGSAPHPEWINTWLTADAVCFDVDSTVIKDEAIDELAKFCGVGEQVSKSNNEAMNGKIPMAEAMKNMMELVKLSKNTVDKFLECHPLILTDGIKELVHILQEKKIDVYLISGGFLVIIETIAKHLNIPKNHIHANILYFDAEGKYGGFDTNQPTSRNGGKAEVIQHLKSKHHYKNVVMIGDGATDMEACPPADLFIGFGGNVVREIVKTQSKWFIMSFKELIDLFQKDSK
ncbi:phosphoserine phosphatase-like [Argonauta hians]